VLIRRVLFVAEAVTLAHVARPIVLARALVSTGCEAVMACDAPYMRFVEKEPWERLPLSCIGSEQFLRALARGSPIYDVQTLRNYVADDLKLIERVKPDLIVGDFRLSLSVSARLAGVPYTAISNAYWSPYLAGPRFPLPVLPMTAVLPIPFARALFNLARPLAFKLHCRSLNQLRREHGLTGLGDDLRTIYTDADFTLYADAAPLFRTEGMPPHHRFLAPIIWSPPVPDPAWWQDLPDDRPIVYVTLGSSGAAAQVLAVVDALATLPISVIVSTAGAPTPSRGRANVYFADYLPGGQAAMRSHLVVCNGGSPTCHQALAAGIPVLGIARNMDQFLNMEAVTGAGAGVMLRADRLRPADVRSAAEQLLASRGYRQAATSLADMHAEHLAPARFGAFVQELRQGQL
jgi:UDP:flavonoid glycosyltransferase YjiC (YdhE family)